MSLPSPRPNWQRHGSERRLQETQPLESVVGGGKTPYKRGRDFEYSVKQQLERRGYFVMRSAASKGKIDLLAVGKHRPALFVQCKRMGQISSGEWNEVFEIATAAGGWPVLAVRSSPRTTAYFRLDGPREYRKRTKPLTQFDPADCTLLVKPPSLFERTG